MLSARRWVRVSSVVALGVVVAGCSSAAKPAAAPSATKARSASPSASPSTGPGTGTADLDGTDLGAALLPASAMPSGYKLDSPGERDTGASTPPDTTQQVSAAKACDLLGDTSWIDATGIVAGTFAQDDYVNGPDTEEIAQEADAYTTSDAEHAMTALWQLFGKCAHFTETASGSTASITMTRSQPAHLGDQAFEAVQTSPAYQGGTTIVAVRVGNVIVSTLDSSSGSDKGSAALTDAEHITQNISKRM